MSNRASRAAAWSLAFNVGQTFLKLGAAGLTGSVSLLGEAIHSAADILASLIAYLGIKKASEPPDDEHPYGHGKLESLAGFAESILIVLTVLYVATEAIRHLIYGGNTQKLESGMVVLAVTATGGFLLSRIVKKVAVEENSLALLADAQHLSIDFVTTVGVLVALAVTHFTKWANADPVFALLLCGHMLYSGWKLGHEAVQQLIDRRLSDDDMALIENILSTEKRMLSYHRLRTRLSGNTRYVDLHAVVPNDWSVVQAHELADSLEERIETALSPCVAVIHVDPFDATKVDNIAGFSGTP